VLRARRQARQIMVGAIECNSLIYRECALVACCKVGIWMELEAAQFLHARKKKKKRLRVRLWQCRIVEGLGSNESEPATSQKLGAAGQAPYN
jgi:hypothetical protein